ncbi:MAG: SDR family oxidoreductase [Bacteroidales bacterium]|nr:SDR family oxidoreductase [Bacteroidales bacterium]
MSNKKHILIVGAGSGIGMTVSETIKDRYHLSLTTRDVSKLNSLNLTDAEFFTADVLKNEDIESLAKNCKDIDGLLYCPGIAPVIPAHHIKEKSLREVMSVNFEGAVLLIGALLKSKKINKGASLLFISSQAVRHPFFGSSVYSASKAAIEAYALSLSKELQSKKIRVNCLAPAYVESPMLDEARMHLSDSFIENMKKMHPDAFAESENIASIIKFLLSGESKSINGQVLQAGSFNINIPSL